jgi:predicted transcriptional regulator
MSDTVTIPLDDSTLASLDALARRVERSRASLVTEAIRDFVALQEWQIAKIEEGIAAADRGDFATEADVARARAKFAPRA